MNFINRRMVVMVIAVVALVAIACGTDEPGSGPTAGPEATPTVGPISTPIAEASDITRALGKARVRWDALGLVDYEFRTNWVCFCPQEFSAQVDLKVQGGEIVSGVYAPDTGFTSAIDLTLYETVVGLFDIITDAIVRDAHSITATYHPEYGYPESVFIDYDERSIDEERGFAIQKLTAPELGNMAPDSSSDLGLLDAARARWEALGLVGYEFRMNWVGFFPFESPLAAQVDLRVRDGELARGTFASESGLTSVVDLSKYETVVGLFDLITEAIVQGAHNIEATYHPEYGYPVSVFIDYTRMIVDEELGIEIQKLTATELGNTHSDELAAARGLWLEADLQKYSFTFQQLCFCPPEIIAPVLIEVRNGEVEAVSRPGSESHLDPPSIDDWLSVEGLFDLVQEAIDRDDDVVDVAYHPEFGYPVSAFFDHAQNASDDGLKFEVSGLVRGDGFIAESTQADLVAAQALWADANPSDYQFEFRWECFCGIAGTGPVEVTVRRNAVVDVRRLDSDAPLSEDEKGSFFTVEGLFAVLSDGFSRNAAKVRANYDASLGYPANGRIDHLANSIDDEIGFSITGFSSN